MRTLPNIRTTTFDQAVKLARSIPDRSLEYLAEPWLPRGELTLLVGDPAIGKSTFAAHIAATIAEHSAQDRKTLFLSSEDYAEIIKQRLQANSQDPEKAPALDRVAVIDDLDLDATYPHGVPELRVMVKEVEERLGEVALLVLDPLLTFLGCGTSSYKKARMEIQALRQWSRTTQTSVLGVIHRTKNGSSTRGSGALVEVVRNIIGIRAEKDSEIRCLYHEKCSFNRLSLERYFRLEDGRIDWLKTK
jgi:predicted ATP-dependent serine protease